MGTYNTTNASMICSRCGVDSRFEIELFFGDTTQLSEVAIGDPYPFFRGRTPAQGGPFEGSELGTAYTECPVCHRDFHCLAEIRAGRLMAVAPDSTREPYIPD